MENWLTFVRWAHVLSAASWLGEVVMINFVLVPALGRLDPAYRARFLETVLPRVFRLASVLSAATVLTGLVLALRLSGGHIEVFITTAWGQRVLAGGSLGFLLMLFHFVMEPKLERSIVAAGAGGDAGGADLVMRRLWLVPRAGLVVLLVIFGLMMYAARGL